MEEAIKIEMSDQGLNSSKEKNNLPYKRSEKKWLIFLIIGIVFFVVGLVCLLYAFLKPNPEATSLHFPVIPSARGEEEKVYSSLDGKELADPNLKNAPAYCIQIPNGLDGARPQAGLTNAGVIFEAIAEAGITRFAAIFQNPTTAVIGPIRSLRIYYLDWDTPFDCAIVHAGGAANALDAVRSGGYKDLTENYSYMYRGGSSSRLWNNLFTTSANLARFSADIGYTSSNLKGFSHLTPQEAERARIDSLSSRLEITSRTENDTSELRASVSEINFNFGGFAGFNVHYSYDINTNRYLRSFRNGEAHNVLDCGNENLGEINPDANCGLVQMAPSSVVAMVVNESKAPDGYYESITTTGSGKVYIFQNGSVFTGTWSKPSKYDQIVFTDDSGEEIKLVPGQAFVSVVPEYGSIEY